MAQSTSRLSGLASMVPVGTGPRDVMPAKPKKKSLWKRATDAVDHAIGPHAREGLHRLASIAQFTDAGDAQAAGEVNLEQSRDFDLKRLPEQAAVNAAVLIPGVSARAFRKTKTPKKETKTTAKPIAAEPAAPRQRLAAQVSLRDLTPEQALEVATKQPHLIQDRAGQYVGGPRGLDSPEKLEAMRKRFDELVDGGAAKGDWYTRAADWIRQVSGGNPAKADRLSDELALTSAQADPSTNLAFTTQGHNAIALTGKAPPIVRTGAQAREMQASHDAGRRIKLGNKTGIYESHMNPRGQGKATGTNDIWHARAFGYSNTGGKEFSRALSSQEHAFLDHETVLAAARANARKAGGRTNWTAAEVQAAPWVRAKAEGLMKKFPKRFTTIEAAMDEAGKTYPDYAPRLTANATHEAIPGRGTGHLEGPVGRDQERRLVSGRQPRPPKQVVSMVDQSPAVREEFSADPRSQWTDAQGRDMLYSAADFYTAPTVDATGYFKPKGGGVETNPAKVSRPLIATQRDAAGANIHPRDRAALTAVEGARAYADVQNMGAWHKLFADASVGASGAVNVPLDRALSRREMIQLQRIVEPHGLGISDTGGGITLMDFADDASGQKVAKLLKEGLGAQIAETIQGAKTADRARLVSDAVDYESAWQQPQGSGAATKMLEEKMTDPQIPHLIQRLDADPLIRDKMRALVARDTEWSQRTGTPAREDVQRARQIIAEHGFAGLFDALKKGMALPALAGATLSLQELAEFLQSGRAALPSEQEDGSADRRGRPSPDA